ncbi:MAG TPA: hypothetical protein VHV55_05460 [Pirellulales bacterium]|jgi:hypothetical protein|nr:hypothetical protein [Pirellulales bacterium]
MQFSPSQLRDDIEFASAVEGIVENCGQRALDVVLSSTDRQSELAIRRLGRTSRERQRFRIEGVAEGRLRSVAPQSGDPVPDTLGFYEVVSLIKKNLLDLERSSYDVRPTKDQLNRARNELERIVRSCNSILDQR